MSGWTFGWILWLLWFFVEESFALIDGGWQATLSGHVWLAFAVKDGDGDMRGRAWAWRLRRIALLAIMVWLTVHFLTGGWA